jgi:hypothetical protein
LAAGGVVEAVARPESLLWVAVVSSVSGDPVELCDGSTVLLACAARRAVVGVFPCRSLWWQLWLLKFQIEMMVMVKPASSEVRDGGSTVPRTINFPAVRGLLPIQAKSGGVAAGSTGGAFGALMAKMGSRRSLL